MNYWTKQEIDILRKNYHVKTPKEISKLIDRNFNAIRDKARTLKLRSYRTWSEADINYLKENYAFGTWPELEKNLNRKKAAIVAYARNFGLVKETRPNSPWYAKNSKFLKKNYATMSNEELAKKLNKPKHQIVAVANNHGLRKSNKSFHRKETRREWTAQEEKFLVHNLGKMKRRDIVAFLGRSITSINHKVEKLGLSEQFVSNLEKYFEAELKILEYNYEVQKPVWKYKIDFMVKNVAIELNGTYWHCDYRAYPEGPKYNTQRNAIIRDRKKYKYLKQKGYKVVIIWEYDFYNNWENVKRNLIAVLQGDLEDYDSAKTVKPEMAGGL
jgi:G:T-mismatch repair DNA endonuclease (very short patch repair protein)